MTWKAWGEGREEGKKEEKKENRKKREERGREETLVKISVETIWIKTEKQTSAGSSGEQRRGEEIEQ